VSVLARDEREQLVLARPVLVVREEGLDVLDRGERRGAPRDGVERVELLAQSPELAQGPKGFDREATHGDLLRRETRVRTRDHCSGRATRGAALARGRGRSRARSFGAAPQAARLSRSERSVRGGLARGRSRAA